MNKKEKGFTLIELLVAMTIVAVLLGLALVSYQGARKSARDGKRKTDLEQIRSALEMYKADNGHYPGSSIVCQPIRIDVPAWGDDNRVRLQLEGGLGGPVYIQKVPNDPLITSDSDCKGYYYENIDDYSYNLTAILETSSTVVYTAPADCTCAGQTFTYKVTNP